MRTHCCHGDELLFELTLAMLFCLGEAKKRLAEVRIEVGLKEEEKQRLSVRGVVSCGVSSGCG